MCPSLSQPPILFPATFVQAPGLWPLIAAVLLTAAHQIAMTLGFAFPRYLADWYHLPSGATRRAVIASIIGFYFCALCGGFILFGGLEPWQSALRGWYARERGLLLMKNCSLSALSALYSQEIDLYSRLTQVALLVFAGASILLLVPWGLRRRRQALQQARTLSYR
jgi:hypothetical protein